MPEEFEGDLAGAVFWGADLHGARFRDVDLTDVTITHAWFVGVNVDALIDRVVINGVDVTAYVNERDPWYPLRAMLRPSTPDDMRAAWSALEDEWAITFALAMELPETALDESVNDEWSFVQTLRHLVFAMDKWFTAPILGESFDPMGLPNSGSVDFPWPGLDRTLTPSFADVKAVRDDRAAQFRGYLESVSADDFDVTVDVLENGPHPVRDVSAHRVRGGVLAQPLRPARPRHARRLRAGSRPVWVTFRSDSERECDPDRPARSRFATRTIGVATRMAKPASARSKSAKRAPTSTSKRPKGTSKSAKPSTTPKATSKSAKPRTPRSARPRSASAAKAPRAAAPDRLATYRRKRDFSVTPEPSGERTSSAPPAAAGNRFVVQRHRATRLHYDLRLEAAGVLLSWAVPKGPTLDPAAKRMAVHVEDHPLGYFDFEGVIPAGEYGGGDVIVWDWGTWQLTDADDPIAAVEAGDLHFDLFGEKLHGHFALVRRGAAGCP